MGKTPVAAKPTRTTVGDPRRGTNPRVRLTWAHPHAVPHYLGRRTVGKHRTPTNAANIWGAPPPNTTVRSAPARSSGRARSNSRLVASWRSNTPPCGSNAASCAVQSASKARSFPRAHKCHQSLQQAIRPPNPCWNVQPSALGALGAGSHSGRAQLPPHGGPLPQSRNLLCPRLVPRRRDEPQCHPEPSQCYAYRSALRPPVLRAPTYSHTVAANNPHCCMAARNSHGATNNSPTPGARHCTPAGAPTPPCQSPAIFPTPRHASSESALRTARQLGGTTPARPPRKNPPGHFWGGPAAAQACNQIRASTTVNRDHWSATKSANVPRD